MHPMTTYQIPFHGVTLYLVKNEREFNQWRAMLPGNGASSTSLSTAIGDCEAMWRSAGAPIDCHYVGPEPRAIDLPTLLNLAKNWERDAIASRFEQEDAAHP